MKDSFLHGLKDAVITNIKYQVNPCYATLELKKSIDNSNSAILFAYTGTPTCYTTYRKKEEQIELTKSIDTSNSATLFAYTGIHNVACSRAKSAKTVGHQISHVKNSIICHQKKCREESWELHIC